MVKLYLISIRQITRFSQETLVFRPNIKNAVKYIHLLSIEISAI